MGIRHAGVATLLLLFVSVAAAAVAQDIPITGVELRLLQKTSGVLRVIIENTQDSSPTLVQLVLSRPSHVGVITYTANLDTAVVKGERRTFDIDLRSMPDV